MYIEKSVPVHIEVTNQYAFKLINNTKHTYIKYKQFTNIWSQKMLTIIIQLAKHTQLLKDPKNCKISDVSFRL